MSLWLATAAGEKSVVAGTPCTPAVVTVTVWRLCDCEIRRGTVSASNFRYPDGAVQPCSVVSQSSTETTPASNR